jgi:hypothetical protein
MILNMKMRSSPTLNYLSIVFGLLILGFTAYYANLALRYGGLSSVLLISILSVNGMYWVYYGYSLLKKPIWFIGAEVIYAQNINGRVIVKHFFEKYEDLIFEKNKLFIIKNDRKLLITKKWKCHPKDWDFMAKQLLQKQSSAQ